MKKYYLVQNAIVRKESFGVIVLLRNGARFSFAQKYENSVLIYTEVKLNLQQIWQIP